MQMSDTENPFLQIVCQPAPFGERLGDLLLSNLSSNRWTSFRAAVAFARYSGVRHLSKAIHDFSKEHTVILSVGLDLGGTSIEALQELLASMQNNGYVWVFHNRGTATFHPKIYLFQNTSEALLIVGSGNLTEGGLYTNYEGSLCATLDLSQKEHRRIADDITTVLDSWATDSEKLAFLLDKTFLAQLVEAGDLLPEAKVTIQVQDIVFSSSRNARKQGIFQPTSHPDNRKPLFFIRVGYLNSYGWASPVAQSGCSTTLVCRRFGCAGTPPKPRRYG